MKKIALIYDLKKFKDYSSIMDPIRCLESSEVDVIAGEINNVRDIYVEYDYLIFAFPNAKIDDEIESFYVQRLRYYCQNLIGDIEQIQKNIAFLENNQHIGMLVCPMDYLRSGNYMHYENWEDSYVAVEQIAKANKLEVPLSVDYPPIMANEGFGIIKTEAINNYENLNVGEASVYVKLAVLSLLVQKNGFLPTYSVSSRSLINNYIGLQKLIQNQIMPPMLIIQREIYADKGDGWALIAKEDYKQIIGRPKKISVEIDVPKDTKYIRFDPCEKFMCICSEVRIKENGFQINNFNGITYGSDDLFLTKDPQYIIEGDFSQVDSITVEMEYMSVFWGDKEFKPFLDELFAEKGELLKAIEYYQGELEQAKVELVVTSEQLNMIYNSTSWKFVQALRKICFWKKRK